MKRLLLLIVAAAVITAAGISAARTPLATVTSGEAGGEARIPAEKEDPGKNRNEMPPSWLPVFLAALGLAAFACLLLWAEFLGRYHREERKPPGRG